MSSSAQSERYVYIPSAARSQVPCCSRCACVYFAVRRDLRCLFLGGAVERPLEQTAVNEIWASGDAAALLGETNLINGKNN